MKTYNEMASDVLRRIGEYEIAQKRKRRIIKQTVLPLGCLCLAVLAGIGVWQNSISHVASDDRPTDSSSQSADDRPTDSSSQSAAVPGADEDYSVFIPAIKPPEASDGMSEDMMELVVYKGNVYTPTGYYRKDDAGELVGDYLGYASGKLDEWSSQEDYAEEFASNITGEVYSVKGYSTGFRICIVYGGYIDIMENLNGIGLDTGKDLFGDRLNIKDRITSVWYKAHYDWNHGISNFHECTLGQEEINAFIDDLFSGKFEYVYDEKTDFYYSGKEQAHLYLDLEDGTTVELRLFEGGYAGYQHLNWYFVKMPGSAFDTVFNACKK